MQLKRLSGLILLAGVVAPAAVLAAIPTPVAEMNLTGTWMGILSLVIFFTAYALIVSEEAIHLRKSKPIMVAAGLIWMLVAVAYIQQGDTLSAGVAFKHDLLEFAELFFFLLVAMTYINTMEERGIFDLLRDWLVVALILNFAVPKVQPDPLKGEAELKHGAWVVVALFGLTITMAVTGHNLLHLPPVAGMMTGLGFLKLFGYYLQRRDERSADLSQTTLMSAALDIDSEPNTAQGSVKPVYDIYRNLQRAEWDSLMFFYGIIMCVGGLGAFGYLAIGSEILYGGLGPTTANILVGVASAIVDNIPVMFAVLEMSPDMNHGQWLLVTLTAGVGGSMLSIGSAASIATHMWLNAAAFSQ